MRIVIASGKGGTGKTTVASNMALSVWKEVGNVIAVDCDVEEPNMHMILKPEIDGVQEVQKSLPVVDYDSCDFCGKCAEVCEYNAIAVIGKKVMIFEDLCHSCGACVLFCPRKAISERGKAIGVIEYGKGIDGIPYIGGRLNVGEAMATPLISEVKRFSSSRAEALDEIIDAPPGTACPVVETLHGADHVILVAEPTPFGLYDLRLTVDVLRVMELDFSVIVNKDGMGFDGVDEFCRKEGLDIILRIPMSMEFARLYSRGEAIVLHDRKWAKRFAEAYECVK